MAIAFGVEIPAALRQWLGSKRLVLDMSDLKPLSGNAHAEYLKRFDNQWRKNGHDE